MRNFERLSRLFNGRRANQEYPSRKGSARSYLVAPQRMQLLVIAKGKRVNCDENQGIEVVNVTETICCGLCRLTTTIAIIFEMGTSAASS